MEQLTQQDLRALLEFLEEIYTLRDLNAFRTGIVSALPKVVPSELTTYNEMHPLKAVSNNWAEPAELGTPAWGQLWEQYMQEHPVLAYNLQTGDNRACKISDFLTRRQFQRLGLYNEFFRRMRMEDVMSFALSASPPLVIGIGLHRAKRNFSERDRLQLNLLRSHLIQAYRNAETVTQVQGELALVRQGVEQTGQGIIILTQDGRVRLMTTRARQWVKKYFGNARPADILPETLQRWLQHQQGLLARADEVPAPREPLVIEHAEGQLTVRLLSDSEQSLLLLEEEAALPSAAFESLGLTRRESEVLAWVVQGQSNYAIGVLLKISESTVKKHLEHIYAKLGVWSRTAAAARARAALTTNAANVSFS